MKSRTLNQLINFFWTVLCCTPLLWYWIAVGWGTLAWIFLGVSFPAGAFIRLQFAKTRRGYEKLGVKTFRKLAQNGDWAQSVTRSSGNIAGNIADAEKYLSTINMYERFHLICGFFFLFSSVHAFASGYWLTGGLIVLANLVFNIAAIILQQYNRMRIGNLMRKVKP